MIRLIDETNNINLNEFDCGDPLLNEYLNNYAKKNSISNISKTYVLEQNNVIVGYVTLAAASLLFAELPQGYQSLPKYPIPAIRIARLAVDKKYQGKHFGKLLLSCALKQILNVSVRIGVKFAIIDAKEGAVGFYQKYGFVPLPDRSNTLIMPIELIVKALTN